LIFSFYIYDSSLAAHFLYRHVQDVVLSRTLATPCGRFVVTSRNAVLNEVEQRFDLVKYCFWSGEATPGVSRPAAIRVRTAYSITAM